MGKPTKHDKLWQLCANKQMYTVSEEVKYFLERHLAGYVEKLGKGGLKMDVNLQPPSIY